MPPTAIDYDTLAQANGGASAGVDYDALARKYGGIAVAPGAPAEAAPVSTQKPLPKLTPPINMATVPGAVPGTPSPREALRPKVDMQPVEMPPSGLDALAAARRGGTPQQFTEQPTTGPLNPLLGAVEAVQGAGRIIGSGAVPPPGARGPAATLPTEEQRHAAMKGTAEVLSGTMSATAPFVLPEALVSHPIRVLAGVGGGMLTGAAARHVAKEVGLSPEAQSLAATLGMFIPAALGVTGEAERTPEGSRASVGMAGGRAGAGVAVTPEQFAVRGKVGPFQGEVSIPRGAQPAGPGLEPPTIEGQPAEAKPPLHASNDVADLKASAERQSPKVGDAVAKATEGVPDAKVEAVRDSKDTDRIEDKAARQGVQPSQIGDIAGAKVTVPDQAAADQVLSTLHKDMPVESVNGSVTGEPGKNAVRQTQAIVDTGAPAGEPIKKAEVMLQTPEMAAATEETHSRYRTAQELRAQGKNDEAEKIENEIARTHEIAEQKANARQAEGVTVSHADDTGKLQTGQNKSRSNAPAEVPRESQRGQEAPRDLLAGNDRGRVQVGTPPRNGENIGKAPAPIGTRASQESQRAGQSAGKSGTFDKQPTLPNTYGTNAVSPQDAAREVGEKLRQLREVRDDSEKARIARSLHELLLSPEVGRLLPEQVEEIKRAIGEVNESLQIGGAATLHGSAQGQNEKVRSGSERVGERDRLQETPTQGPKAPIQEVASQLEAKLNTGAPRAPKPPAKQENFRDQQVEVRGPDGNWKPGKVEYDNVNEMTGANNGVRRLRGVFDDGSKFNNARIQDVRKPAQGTTGTAQVPREAITRAEDQRPQVGRPNQAPRPVSKGTTPVGTATKKADIGVDFDGTLFKEKPDGSIGEPIPERIASVQKMLADGKKVIIETRRVQDRPEEAAKIQDALEAAGLPRLPVTGEKLAPVLIDDSAHHVETNQNTPLPDVSARKPGQAPVPLKAKTTPESVTPKSVPETSTTVPQKGTKEPKYKLGSTQANIPADSEASKALARARARIPESDLAGKGKESEPHVTVKYGIQGEDTEGIRKHIASLEPFEASLGKTDVFPPSEHSDGAAVVMAPIVAPELHKINAELAKHGDFKESDFEYRPHATISYVKPEVADRYKGMNVTAGAKFPVKEIAITDRNGKQTLVKLEGLAPGEQAKIDSDLKASREFSYATRSNPGQFRAGTDADGNKQFYMPFVKDGKRIGSGRVSARPDIGEGVAETHRVDIDEANQGKGYARELYGQLYTKAKEQGFTRLVSDSVQEVASRRAWEGMVRRGLAKQITDPYGATRFEYLPPEVAASKPHSTPERPTGSAPAPLFSGPKPGYVGEMNISDLKVAPAKFQYKLSTDAEGVGTLLKDTKVYNPDLAGVISVWRDPEDGKTYVVNGHHRYELARRTGQKIVTVRHILAKDATEARAIGALQNIAEGRGTAIDAAKFFRDTGITPDHLAEKGISMGEKTAADGLAMSKLEPSIFAKVVSGDVRQGRAVAIGEATADHAEQKAILSLVDKRERGGGKVSDSVLSELIRLVKGSEKATETTADLFGSQEISRSLAMEKAEVSSYIKQELAKDKRLFGFVAKEGRATELARAGNKIDVEKSKAISTGAAQAEEVYNKLSSRGGPIASILDESARRLADGENAGKVKSDAYQRIRSEVSQTLGTAAGPGAQGREGAPDVAGAVFSQDAQPLASAAVGPIAPSDAKKVSFELKQPGNGLPNYLRVSPEGIGAIGRALGVRMRGVNMAVTNALNVADVLDKQADTLENLRFTEAAGKLRALSTAMRDNADERDGLTVVGQNADPAEELRVVREELFHSAVQRRPGKGDVLKGVPWRDVYNDPGFAGLRDILIEQFQGNGLIPHPAALTAEAVVDLMTAENFGGIRQAELSVIRYFEAARKLFGDGPLRDAQAIFEFLDNEAVSKGIIRQGEEFDAGLTSATRDTLEKLRAEGNAPGRGAEVAGGSQGTSGEPGPGQPQGSTETGTSNANRRPGEIQRSNKTPEGTDTNLHAAATPGLTDEELADWSKSKGFRTETAGEQLGMFGDHDTVLRVFRLGPKGKEQAGLVYQNQLDRLKESRSAPPTEPFTLTGGESREEQPRLFGAGDLGEIIGPRAPKPLAATTPRKNEGSLFSLARAPKPRFSKDPTSRHKEAFNQAKQQLGPDAKWGDLLELAAKIEQQTP